MIERSDILCNVDLIAAGGGNGRNVKGNRTMSTNNNAAGVIMVSMNNRKRFMALALLVASGLLLAVGSAQAQSAAWTNDADSNWSLGSNWKTGSAATNTTGVAYFTNTITAARTVNLDVSPWTINGLTFTNSGAFGWAITNGTLNLAGATPTITVNASSTATVQSAVSGANGLKMAGNGLLILSGSNTFTGGVTIGTGNSTLSKLVLGGANALNSTPGSENAVTLNCEYTCGLFLNGNSVSLSSLTGGDGHWVRNNSGTAATLTVGNSLNLDSPFVGSLSDSQTGVGGGALTVVKMGSGIMTLTYGKFSGGLFIKAGVLSTGGNNAENTVFGAGAITLGDSTVGQDATLKLAKGGLTCTNSITIDAGAGARTIVAAYATDVSTFSGAIVLNTNLTVQTTNNVTSPTLVLSGALSGTGSLILNDVSTAGGITLSGTNTYTGATTIQAGRVTITGSGKLGNGNYPGVISNNGALIYNSSADQALGGISGSGSLTVSAGMLGCTGTISGPVSVTAVGSLAPSLGTGGSNTLTLASSLTLNSGSRLNFALSSSTATNDQIKITGGLTLNGPNYITLSFPGGTAPVGTYTLMTYASTNGAGSLVLDATYPNAALSYDNTKVTLTVSGGSTSAGSTLTWKGNVDGNWDTSTLNWTNMAGSAVTYSDGQAVKFDQNASGFNVTGTVSVVSPDSVTISNVANAYTIRANIGGSGYLVKNGSGTATLTGTNSYTGFTTIGAGTLTIGGAGQLGGGAYAGVITHNGVGLNFASSAPNTLSGGITAGSGSVAPVTSSGTGLLTLSGVNSISTLTISTGTTVIANTTSLSDKIAIGSVAGSPVTLIISNGTVTSVNACSIGSAAGQNSNLVVVTGSNSLWNPAGKELYIGSATGSTTGNVVRVENGGVITNLWLRLASPANSVNNALIITNGGKVYLSKASTMGRAAGGVLENYFIIAGGGATLNMMNFSMNIGDTSLGVSNNWIKVDQGGVVTNGSIEVSKLGVENYLIITNGGKAYVTTLVVGNGVSANANGLRLSSGGLLEVASAITLGNAASSGNTLTNLGGILQFSSATPPITIANYPNNALVITNGTVSFRNVNPVNLTNNWVNSGIGTNTVSWQGNNTLRLDGSTATNTLGRPYQFNTGFGPTNYVNLELLNTSFVKGNEIVIGTNGTMTLVSGATAVLTGVTTNYGTIAGSGMVSGRVAMASGSILSPAGTETLSFSSNLTFVGSGSITCNWNYTSSTCSVVRVGGTLTLPSDVYLNVIGIGTLPANPVLFSWQGANPSTTFHIISTPADIYTVGAPVGNTYTLKSGSRGCMMIIQ